MITCDYYYPDTVAIGHAAFLLQAALVSQPRASFHAGNRPARAASGAASLLVVTSAEMASSAPATRSGGVLSSPSLSPATSRGRPRQGRTPWRGRCVRTLCSRPRVRPRPARRTCCRGRQSATRDCSGPCAGAIAAAIMERRGHSPITVTLNTYGHLLPGLEQHLTEALDARGREARALARSVGHAWVTSVSWRFAQLQQNSP
jgi:hypothetical protein